MFSIICIVISLGLILVLFQPEDWINSHSKIISVIGIIYVVIYLIYEIRECWRKNEVNRRR